jgi:hypothetical protein
MRGGSKGKGERTGMRGWVVEGREEIREGERVWRGGSEGEKREEEKIKAGWGKESGWKEVVVEGEVGTGVRARDGSNRARPFNN